MEDYKVIIVKLARPDEVNGAKIFSRLLGIPEEKSLNLIAMMPFVLFEVKNFAIARKFKALLSPMEAYGFPILISLEAGPISKVNWPKNIRINGMLIDDIIHSVPEFFNLINRCPSCGTELRYQIHLRIENENVQIPVDPLIQTTKVDAGKVEDDSLVELDEIEELTVLDEIAETPSAGGDFVAQVVEAEEFDPNLVDDLFEEVDPKGQKRKSDQRDAFEEPVFEAVSAIDADFDLGLNFEESKSQIFGGEYSIAVNAINSLNDRIKAAKVLSEILGIPESDALLKVKKTGDLIVQNITLEEAKRLKRMFDQKNLSVQIIN